MLHIALERQPVKKYHNGLLSAFSFLILLAALCVIDIVFIFHTQKYQSFNVSAILDTVQAITAVVCLVACLSLPRRPSVSDNNHVVDGQYTVSALSVYTFGFASDVLSLARKRKSLDLVDLPKLNLWVRSSFLLAYFGNMTSKTDRLWKSIIYAHYPELLFQTAWAIMQSVSQFAPQFAMYSLLRLLEQRSLGASVENEAWGLVLALFLSIVFASWTQAWLHWMCWARLGQPVRAELSALIFDKSLRRKDVKGAGKDENPDKSASSDTAIVTNDLGGEGQRNPLPAAGPENEIPRTSHDDGDEDLQKSRQSTINLVVSVFARLLEGKSTNTCSITREWMPSESVTSLSG